MDINIKTLHPDAIVPKYASEGAACFDLHSLTSGTVVDTAKFDTGIAFEIPADHAMLVFSRSGHGFNNDVRLANCVGMIDPDYRGSVKVKLTNDSQAQGAFKPFQVNAGDRIAQALVIPRPRINFVVVDELSDTARGDGGFGSTGTQAITIESAPVEPEAPALSAETEDEAA